MRQCARGAKGVNVFLLYKCKCQYDTYGYSPFVVVDVVPVAMVATLNLTMPKTLVIIVMRNEIWHYANKELEDREDSLISIHTCRILSYVYTYIYIYLPLIRWHPL